MIRELTRTLTKIAAPPPPTVLQKEDVYKIELKFKGSRRESVEEWIQHVELRTKDLSDEKRIQKALGSVSNVAEKVLTNAVKDLQEKNNCTWDNVKKEMKDSFLASELKSARPVNVEQTESESAYSYYVRYNETNEGTTTPLDDNVIKFLRGLNSRYINYVRFIRSAWILQGKPVTMTLKKWATILDDHDLWARIAQEKEQSTQKNKTFEPFKSKALKPEKKSFEKKDQNKKTCYECKKLGKNAYHSYMNCPLFKAKSEKVNYTVDREEESFSHRETDDESESELAITTLRVDDE
jgi:hypothetical protein